MLEVDCSILTPEDVFKTSGHVDRFSDWICKDSKNGDYLRADHLIENELEARLKGDRAVRGFSTEEGEERSDDAADTKKKAKAVKLDEEVVNEYEKILAKVKAIHTSKTQN